MLQLLFSKKRNPSIHINESKDDFLVNQTLE